MNTKLKKLLCIFLSVLTIVTTAPAASILAVMNSEPIVALAATGSNRYYDYTIIRDTENEKCIELTNYKGILQTSINIPSEINGYKVVGLRGTFNRNKKIKSVVVPEGIEYIEEQCFQYCSNLDSITLPSALKYIGDYAFSGLSIKSINIPDSLEYISPTAFNSASLPDSDFVFPDSIKYISPGCFYGSNITSVHVGPDVKIADVSEYNYGTDLIAEEILYSECGGMFCGRNLTTIDIDENNSYLTVLNNVLYSKDMKYLLAYPEGLPKQDFTIPDEVEVVACNAFAADTELAALTIGSGMKEIRNGAFSEAKIEQLIFPENAQIEKIEEFSFHNLSGELILPKSLKDIGYGAFYDSDITKLSFETPSSCTTIRDEAFYNCHFLEEVFIPNSVTRLGAPTEDTGNNIRYNVFWNCNSLKKVVFEDNCGLENFDAGNFTDAGKDLTMDMGKNSGVIRITGRFPSELKSVNLSGCANLTALSDNAFHNCKKLEEIDLSSTQIDKIDKDTFNTCSSLHSVMLPDTVEHIDENAFCNCSSLININLENVFIIHETAFKGTNIIAETVNEEKEYNGFKYYESENHIAVSGYTGNDVDVVIPNTIHNKPVTMILQYAFKNLSLNSIIFPSKLERIGSYAFSNCAVTTISAFPDTLTYIGKSAFGSNKNLTTDIVIPNRVVTIDDFAFNGCRNVTSVTLGNAVSTIGKKAFALCDITEITVPDSVTSIGENVFQNSAIKTITFGSRINNIESIISDNTKTLENINVSKNNPYYKSTDGVVYSKDGKKLLIYPFAKPDETFVFADGLQVIESEFFKSVKYLKNPVFPDTLTTISYRAFADNKSIESVSIPASVTKLDYAFDSCTNLKDVHFEDHFTADILEGTFYDCTALENVTFGKNVRITTFDSTFTKSGIKTIDLDCYTEFLSAFAFMDSQLEEITLREGIKSIGGLCFSNTKLINIVLPKTVQLIDKQGFSDCRNLSCIELNNAKNIKEKAFENCISLESIDLTGVIVVDDTAFSGCDNLKKFCFTKDELETYIAEHEFRGNKTIETVVIGSSINEIQDYAFADCQSLENALISASVTEIADTAFDNCGELTIVCMAQSYAMDYAIRNDIPYTTFVVDPIPDQTYTGKEITPELNVSAQNRNLDFGSDYTAVYTDNIEVGNAKVNVIGLGDFSIFASLVHFNIIKGNYEEKPDDNKNQNTKPSDNKDNKNENSKPNKPAGENANNNSANHTKPDSNSVFNSDTNKSESKNSDVINSTDSKANSAKSSANANTSDNKKDNETPKTEEQKSEQEIEQKEQNADTKDENKKKKEKESSAEKLNILDRIVYFFLGLINKIINFIKSLFI